MLLNDNVQARIEVIVLLVFGLCLVLNGVDRASQSEGFLG